ncbi:MAG: TPM domain-containing protein, partial [Ignavibacteria bacterium]
MFLTGISAQPDIPVVKNYANDFTGTLTSAQLSRLNKALYNFDRETSTQIVFVIVNTLEGYPIEYFANELAEKNKIGRKGKDNGVLLVVAKNDRKMRIEVGYGLEGALPDALASSIIRNEIAPYFKTGDYYNGIVSGLNAIISATKGEYVNENKEEPGKKKKGNGFIFYIIMFILFILFSRGRGGGLGTLLFLGSMGGFGGGSRGGG